MALPLLLLVPKLIAWGGAMATAYGLGGMFGTEPIKALEKIVVDWLVAYAASRAGLVLDSAEPFSDASLSNALSLRTGVTIRSLKNRDSIELDIEGFALGKIEEKTGFRISTLRDVEQMKADLAVIGLAIVQQKTGIPITPPVSGADWVEPLKNDLKDWARASLMTEMGGRVSDIVAEMGAFEDLEALAVSLNQRLVTSDSVREFTAKGLAVGIAEKLVSESVSRFEVTAAGAGKKGRRALQLREAQRRFRAKWGNRSEYLPVQ